MIPTLLNLPWCASIAGLGIPIGGKASARLLHKQIDIAIGMPQVVGRIVIRNVDRKCMKVTSTHGLEFRDETFDDNAEFRVKLRNNGKVSFLGNNGKYVNMYYISDVKCEGPEGGLEVGIIYLADDMMYFTVSGYSGQDRRTKFLSSEAGNSDYKGSLAVKDFPDNTCLFTIENRYSIDEHEGGVVEQSG